MEVGASAPVPALPSRSWPEKLHFPDSRPLSPVPSPGDPASAVLQPTKCPAQLHTPRTPGQAPACMGVPPTLSLSSLDTCPHAHSYTGTRAHTLSQPRRSKRS